MAVCAGTSQIGRVFKRSGMEKKTCFCVKSFYRALLMSAYREI